MEKRCEFCIAFSPVVYCKSDAAHLCLSCDAKVHSANALSYRHPRTLVCESCRYQPAIIRCFDHKMFMCQSCDAGLHVSSPHRRKVVSCYVGCPSAKDLAELWGFDLKELDNNSVIESEGGSSSRGTKVLNDDNQQKGSYLILQQILGLERLQLSEGVDNSCVLNVRERRGELPFRNDAMWKEHKMLDDHLEHFDGHLEFQHKGIPLEDKREEPLSSPFSQLDNLTNAGNPLNGDSFWQSKSPIHNNEIWLQNMQDLGVCDEVQCFDDVNIPDVDLTFRNFEELFGSEQDPSRVVVDDKNMACSFAEKLPWFGKLDRDCASTIEDISGHSPVSFLQQSDDANKEISTLNQIHRSQSNHPLTIRPSYSASSFSLSRITGESTCSEYKDDGLSPTFPKQQLSHFSSDSETTKLDGKENAITRYKEKKILRHERQTQYTSPRSKSEFKKRGKGQVMKVEGLDRDSANVTQSF